MIGYYNISKIVVLNKNKKINVLKFVLLTMISRLSRKSCYKHKAKPC